MKRLIILLFAIPLFASAQGNLLMVQGVSPSLYLLHTVTPKENWYSIGRMYNISPKEIAPFNNMDLTKGLSLGQTIKIPLGTTNFSQTDKAAPDEKLIPLYHTVQQKESLYHISAVYNKVLIESLRKWNNLTADAVSNGTNLIVGYIKVKKDLSTLGSAETETPIAKIDNTPTTTAPIIRGTPATAVSDQTMTEKPVTTTPQKTTPKFIEPETTEQSEPVEKKETVEKQEIPDKTETAEISEKSTSGGAFKTDYDRLTDKTNLTKESGAGAVFKSTSGFDDGKYYCLQNNAPSGTIIKVTNAANGKSVYAKVLDVIPDMKQNTGLIIRISNAAAEALGIGDESRFDCTLEYSK